VSGLAVGRGFIEASVTAAAAGVSAQLEAGYRATVSTSLYGFVRASSDWRAQWAASAGVGVQF